MPYIPAQRRERFEESIKTIVEYLGHPDAAVTSAQADKDNTAKGDLNYVIFSIIKRYIEQNGVRYHRLQDFVNGTLGVCQMEANRRLVAPYEDEAIERNGDVK
jgi:hypothetical protein